LKKIGIMKETPILIIFNFGNLIIFGNFFLLFDNIRSRVKLYHNEPVSR